MTIVTIMPKAHACTDTVYTCSARHNVLHVLMRQVMLILLSWEESANDTNTGEHIIFGEIERHKESYNNSLWTHRGM